jgi:hypothetical protein
VHVLDSMWGLLHVFCVDELGRVFQELCGRHPDADTESVEWHGVEVWSDGERAAVQHAELCWSQGTARDFGLRVNCEKATNPLCPNHP